MSSMHWFLKLNNEQKKEVIKSCPTTKNLKFDVRKKLCGLEGEQITEIYNHIHENELNVKLHDIVYLKQSESNVPKGAKGVIVYIYTSTMYNNYKHKTCYEVEFPDNNNVVITVEGANLSLEPIT